ncbi:MAG: porin family protein [Bacteroidia bacterium]
MSFKLIFFIISCLIFSIYAGAQNFKGSLLLGVNAAQIHGDGMGGFNKLGIMGGVGVTLPFSEKWSGRMELNYSRKGSREDLGPDGTGQQGAWALLKVNYAEVPISAIYHWKEKLNFQGGLGVAFLINYTAEDPIGAPYTLTPGNELRPYDLTAHLGLAYQFTDRISGLIRYSQSWASIGRDGRTLFSVPYGGLYNIIVNIGVRYDLSKQ